MRERNQILEGNSDIEPNVIIGHPSTFREQGITSVNQKVLGMRVFFDPEVPIGTIHLGYRKEE